MPYSSKKTGKNEITVYKKGSGEVVGHTTPEKYNDYMAALHIHSGDNAADGGIAAIDAKKPPISDEPGIQDATVSDFLLPALLGRIPAGALGALGKAAPAAEDAYGTAMREAMMKSMGTPAGGYAKGGIVAPYPENRQEREEEGTKGSTDEANDPEFEKMPHLALGDVLGDFNVDTGDSDTAKGFPVNPPTLPPQAAVPPPTAPGPAQTAAPTALTQKAANPRPLPGMPADVTPDTLAPYIAGQKERIAQYGPQQQLETARNLIQARSGIGPSLASAGAGLADAIMQGVARAGNPGFQERIQNQGNQLAGEAAGAMERAGTQNLQQIEAGQKLDAMDPASPLSKAAQQSIGQVLIGSLGYKPGAVAKMSAAQINNVADLGMKYEDIKTQKELKEATLAFQAKMGEYTAQNEQLQRELQYLNLAAAHPLMSLFGKLPAPSKLGMTPGAPARPGAAPATVRDFKSVEDAEAAGLPVGTRVTVNGRSATIR